MKKAIFGLLLVVHSTSTHEVKSEEKDLYRIQKISVENGTKESTTTEIHFSFLMLPGQLGDF